MSGNTGGNRQDNRSRGNAAQLLEKYKSLARDAQLAGDRVQTEYYLQFADHYFRVLGESRSRFEEQRRARGEDFDDEEFDDEGLDGDGDDGSDPQPQQQQQQQRGDRQDRQRERGERRPRGDGDGDGERRERLSRDDRGERPERSERPERGDRSEPRGRLNGRSRVDEARENEAPAQIAFDTLPPAIGITAAPDGDSASEAGGADEAPRPRRRTRRPRVAEGDGEIAPAA